MISCAFRECSKEEVINEYVKLVTEVRKAEKVTREEKHILGELLCKINDYEAEDIKKRIESGEKIGGLRQLIRRGPTCWSGGNIRTNDGEFCWDCERKH